MRYLWQHIRTITDSYDGNVPLTHFLKNYYKQNPVLGSRDRRMLGGLSYSWYRCVKGIEAADTTTYEQRMLVCIKVCGAFTVQFEKMFAGVELPSYKFNAATLFPYNIEMSDGIDKAEWLASMIVQPQLFIRLRKNKEKIFKLLSEQGILFEQIDDTCLSLPNGAAIDTLLPADSYVVQDFSSQGTGAFFNPYAGERWYDCCSGAGGKSLLLMDMCAGVQLTVSDKRRSILNNLEERFKKYNHTTPEVHVADSADEKQIRALAGGRMFDNIISDVPCSGSGTWARTPEQLHFFKANDLPDFPMLQKRIALNVSKQLRKGGRLIYITCSVFKQENEEVVNEIVQQRGMQIKEMQLINGIANRADSMFIAVLQ